MKLLIFLFLNSFLLSRPGITEIMPTKSEILKKSNECFNISEKQECKKLILQIEKLQVVEFERNRFKCQSSLLGLQSTLIESKLLESSSTKLKKIMIPYVKKNC